MSPTHHPPTAPPSAAPVISEVRYSLPALLKELVYERTTGSLAMEKLNQGEITRMFKTKKGKRRG